MSIYQSERSVCFAVFRIGVLYALIVFTPYLTDRVRERERMMIFQNWKMIFQIFTIKMDVGEEVINVNTPFSDIGHFPNEY